MPKRADTRSSVRENQVAVRDDHPLDRQVGERVERREQAHGVGLVHEHVKPPTGSAEDVAADERRVLADEEHDLLRLAVELDRLDSPG